MSRKDMIGTALLILTAVLVPFSVALHDNDGWLPEVVIGVNVVAFFVGAVCILVANKGERDMEGG